jgi:hypothetical protein
MVEAEQVRSASTSSPAGSGVRAIFAARLSPPGAAGACELTPDELARLQRW